MPDYKLTYRYPTYLLLFLSVLPLCYLTGCSGSGESNEVTEKQLQKEKQIVAKHCGSCHQLTPPEWLDKKTWLNHVLPAMAPKLGIGLWRDKQYYPAGSRAIDFKEWLTIVNYFKREAPEVLAEPQPPVQPKQDWAIFSMQKPKLDAPGQKKASTTMVKIDAGNSAVFYANATDKSLFRWDMEEQSNQNLLPLETPGVGLTIMDAKESGSRQAIVTTLGTMLAEDISRGVVQKISLNSDSAFTKDIIADRLTRPVKTLQGDFNRDGRPDYLICVFGHDTGGLYLYEQTGANAEGYRRKPIWEVPGAEDAVVNDFNNDGWPDILTLFAYGNEGIWLFLNDKEGGFTSRNILQFPSVFGSTSFQLADFNQDGLQDLMLTNGDNADFSRILKPYHGLRIFLNQGDYRFREEASYFYPMHGTTNAIAEDFDLDGDLDIATISYFADFENKPQNSFIYFEQTAPMDFIPHALPIHKEGRWLVVDAADIDNDGDTDLAIGNFARRFMGNQDIKPTWNMHSPFIILRNDIR